MHRKGRGAAMIESDKANSRNLDGTAEASAYPGA
jgi:hypothetical protein